MTDRIQKESDELLCTVWSLVMVRSRLPAQVIKNYCIQLAFKIRAISPQSRNEVAPVKITARCNILCDHQNRGTTDTLAITHVKCFIVGG